MSDDNCDNLGELLKAATIKDLIGVAQHLGDSDPLGTAQCIRSITARIRSDFERKFHTTMKFMTPEQLHEWDKALYRALANDSRTGMTIDETGNPLFTKTALVIYEIVDRLDKQETTGGGTA